MLTGSPTDETLPVDVPPRDDGLTPGLSDALGDRALTFDPDSATSLEALTFRQEFSDLREFRRALGERVERLRRLHHPRIARALHVGGLLPGERLTLVSKHASGPRLSDVLDKARGPAFALELLRHMTTALTALQGVAAGIAHGLLTAERIVVTRDGLVLVDHALGSAVEAVRLPAARLRSEFDLLAGDEFTPPFSPRADMLQLGYLALSLLVGRRLDPSVDTDLTALLGEFVDADATGAPNARQLRRWLERALQLDAPFDSAASAYLALNELPTDIEADVPKATRRTIAPPASVPPPPPNAAPDAAAMDTVMPATSVVRPPDDVEPAAPPRGRGALVMRGLAVAVVAEAIAIAGLVGTRPQPIVLQLRPPVAAPAALGALAVPASETTAASGAPLAPATGVGQIGGITVSSAIDLRVLEKGAEVGSSTGRIALAEGTHELDFANDDLGFKTHQTVVVTAGQMTPVTIALPNGRLSVNAVPWADVWIDGKAAGQTPLANLQIPIGTHDILLKHPQLGEQHQTAVVKVDGQTRVSVTFQK